ncbi:MAG TPA: hypothetical protein VFU31_20910 [Candidatus Binatia bacterium]|nr:hypothetical protein [Candidatus Binatia bacterium]
MSDFTPEIVDDELSELLTKLCAQPDVNTVLEIGSGDGRGSTQAILKGLAGKNPRATLGCLEIKSDRYEALLKNIEPYSSQLYWIHCGRLSSVPVSEWMRRSEIERFYKKVPTKLNDWPLEQVLGWWDDEAAHAIVLRQEGIQIMKQRCEVTAFDLVLLDGSPFCGEADLRKVWGAKYLVLDDIDDIKNRVGFIKLLDRVSGYKLLKLNRTLRNGYAAFQRA